jgi:ribose 5-phosphate isomerase B
MSSLTTKVVHLATDHAGFEHKEAIKNWLKSSGVEVVDHGAIAMDAMDDFPDFIALAAAAVSVVGEGAVGIIFGGSGQGEAMVANRFPNVRATVYYGSLPEIITLSREHNDANVLSIGARFVSIDECKEVITKWFEGRVLPEEKYRRRNQKIERVSRDLHKI